MISTNIYRVFHLNTTKECTFFSAAHGTFAKIDHIIEHKVSLDKYIKIEIAPYILSDQEGLKMNIKKIIEMIEKFTNL